MVTTTVDSLCKWSFGCHASSSLQTLCVLYHAYVLFISILSIVAPCYCHQCCVLFSFLFSFVPQDHRSVIVFHCVSNDEETLQIEEEDGFWSDHSHCYMQWLRKEITIMLHQHFPQFTNDNKWFIFFLSSCFLLVLFLLCIHHLLVLAVSFDFVFFVFFVRLDKDVTQMFSWFQFWYDFCNPRIIFLI